jgi:hypothetical protein
LNDEELRAAFVIKLHKEDAAGQLIGERPLAS